MKTLIVIPARLASTRLPKKLLLAETGKTLIEHTYRAAQQSRLASRVLVAADDVQLVEAVQGFGGEVCLTRVEHASGTDRLAEVAERETGYDLFCNVQGDEPEIEGAVIDAAIALLQRSPQAMIATVATPLSDPRLLGDPACVKVVLNHQSSALYFSRSQIPYPRQTAGNPPPVWYQHVGLYVYRREFLQTFTQLPPSPLERTESLEQLRALENGYSIAVAVVDRSAKGIDTIEDYRAFVTRQRVC